MRQFISACIDWSLGVIPIWEISPCICIVLIGWIWNSGLWLVSLIVGVKCKTVWLIHTLCCIDCSETSTSQLDTTILSPTKFIHFLALYVVRSRSCIQSSTQMMNSTLPSGSIFQELQCIRDTGFFCPASSLDDDWQQVNLYFSFMFLNTISLFYFDNSIIYTFYNIPVVADNLAAFILNLSITKRVKIGLGLRSLPCLQSCQHKL